MHVVFCPSQSIQANSSTLYHVSIFSKIVSLELHFCGQYILLIIGLGQLRWTYNKCERNSSSRATAHFTFLQSSHNQCFSLSAQAYDFPGPHHLVSSHVFLHFSVFVWSDSLPSVCYNLCYGIILHINYDQLKQGLLLWQKFSLQLGCSITYTVTDWVYSCPCPCALLELRLSSGISIVYERWLFFKAGIKILCLYLTFWYECAKTWNRLRIVKYL